jgi:antitoxin (DNA-binding transcriptional repressor) of toxin-antitoxin stability system
MVHAAGSGGLYNRKSDRRAAALLCGRRERIFTMPTLTIEDAQAHLDQIIAGLKPGEEIVIADQGQPIAKLVRSERATWPCKAGSAKDTNHWRTPDFDAPLEDFREHME